MSDDSLSAANFDGTVRLFPLPNLVLFPHVVQPLHIFEPRYRQMTADALAGDRLIAMALLVPGWEADYEGRPAIHPMVCIGRIVNEQHLPDGRYNMLLRGLSRARVVQEIAQDKVYRSARVELQADSPAPSKVVASEMRKQIEKAALAWLPAKGPPRDQLRKLLESDMPLGVLSDILGFALPLPLDAKQRLLGELSVEQRVRFLLQFLAEKPAGQKAEAGDRRFPPDFSSN
jgi:Lon protease-like protein